MVPGLGGRLVSHAYVEQQLLPARAAVAGSWSRRARSVNWRGGGDTSTRRLARPRARAPFVTLRPRHCSRCWGIKCRRWCLTSGDSPDRLGPVRSRNRRAAMGGVARFVVDATSFAAALACGARWAMVTNGHSLRIVDCSRIWTRQAVDFDFATLLTDARGVAALLASGRRAVGAGHSRRGIGSTFSARLSLAGQRRARRPAAVDRIAAGIRRRVATNLQVVEARRQTFGLSNTFEQALTIVYRVLFLLFAEARGLVPVWNDVYRDAYTIDALCRRMTERPGAPGLWASLQAISRLAHAGCRAGDLTVTPFNGRLFSPCACAACRAARRARRRSPGGGAVSGDRRIGHRPAPHRVPRPRCRAARFGLRARARVRGRARPRGDRAQTHVDRTQGDRQLLYAAIDDRVPGAAHAASARRSQDGRRDSRCASSIRRWAAARFSWPRATTSRTSASRRSSATGRGAPAEVTAADRIGLRRKVAERCLYGVDLNPTAVQLARLSLWLTTLASDRPLTFLDHHLAVGDSLIGARLSGSRSIAHRRCAGAPAQADPQLPLFDDDVAGVARAVVLPARFRLALEPSDTLDAVKAKERTLAALAAPDGPLSKWSAAADVWCAASFWPGAPPRRRWWPRASPALSAESPRCLAPG